MSMVGPASILQVLTQSHKVTVKSLNPLFSTETWDEYDVPRIHYYIRRAVPGRNPNHLSHGSQSG